MSEWMDRIFRRAQPVKVVTEKGEFARRGIIQELVQGTELDAVEPMRYGRVSVPLYRYMGNAKEILDSEKAKILSEDGEFAVLHAKEVSGFSGCRYIEAVLERQVTADDGE